MIQMILLILILPLKIQILMKRMARMIKIHTITIITNQKETQLLLVQIQIIMKKKKIIKILLHIVLIMQIAEINLLNLKRRKLIY